MSSQSRHTRIYFYLFLIVSILSLLESFRFHNLFGTIILASVIIILVLLTRTTKETAHSGATKVRLLSLQVASGVVVLEPWWKSLLNLALKPFFKHLPVPANSSESPSIIILFFLTIVILIVNYYTQDRTVMGKHSTPLEKEFPEQSYRKRLKTFCDCFTRDIQKINGENNWSPDTYISLEAEVEVQSGNKRLRKITDLLNAIRADKKSRVFLVLGDPGSGKSVALRKLCLDLFSESEKTGKAPIYINLKEWKPEKPWTEDTPPTVEELHKFVRNNLLARGDVFTNAFIKKAFNNMLLNGRFFIILDSFDEIPSVLDEKENSWLIDQLSDVIHRFLCSANESRGLLASRFFRKPTSKFNSKTTLEIRPLTENRIIDLLKNSINFNEKLVKLIFKERQEFVPIARNPFTATLISSYAETHDNNLPDNQAELYASYINQKLEASIDRIKKNGLEKDDVILCATNISDLMFTTQSLGLEISISELNLKLPNFQVEKVIDILKYVRLGRLGSGDEQQFSFVHRRFNEYFVVINLIKEPERVLINAIPSDSRLRDALVLYCEVADEEKAKEIANFCWTEIRKIIKLNVDMSDPQFFRMIHCLRFIKDAFRARVSCIEDFRKDLKDLIQSILQEENILLQKIAVEAVGVLRYEDIDKTIIQAIKIDDFWINETALKACRHLPKISNDLRQALIHYINNFNPLTLIRKKDELLFSLNLSDGFIDVRNFLEWRIIDIYIFLIAYMICFVTNPPVLLLLTIIFYLIIVIFKNLFFEVPILKQFVFRNDVRHNYLSVREYYFSLVLNLMMLNLKPRLMLAIAALSAQLFIMERDFCLAPDMCGNLKPLIYLDLVLLFPISYIPYYFTSLIKKVINHFSFSNFTSLVKEVINDFSFSNFSFLSVFRMLSQVLYTFIFKYFKLFLITYIPFGILYLLFMIFLDKILSYFKKIQIFDKYIIIGVEIFRVSILLSFIIFIVFLISRYIEDWRLLRDIPRGASLTRSNIDRQLKVYKTRWGRMEYVKILRHENINPTGNWLEGKLPNYKDEASSVLARLEEKWLGLDR